MKNYNLILIACCVMFFLANIVYADWMDGDGHKMHYPQLPDENGWDIDMTAHVLADDWECSSSGPVSDIHFWYSIQDDNLSEPIPPPHIEQVDVSIHNDLPANDPDNPEDYSMPDDLLWAQSFTSTQFKVNGPFQGVQGWDDPAPNTDCITDDHLRYWQVNITDIVEPYFQEEGEIYWLDLHVISEGGPLGWKTTTDIFNDAAVYQNPSGEQPAWLPIAVCTENRATDLAFVITPEPSTFMLLGVAVFMLLKRRYK